MKQDNTKESILEKALELFSERGYDSVSVGEIAEAVGIKAPSLYNHYKSKQAIFDAIVDYAAVQYGEYTDSLSVHVENAGRDIAVFSEITEEVLAEKVRQIFIYSLHNKTISRLRRMMTIEQFRSPRLSAMYSERYIDRLAAYHSELFERLIEKGVIVGEAPETLSLMYVSPIIALLGVCDRQPERKDECLAKLGNHVKLFYRRFGAKRTAEAER